MSDDWPKGDPFSDPSDPAAREREERRREREAKRAQRDAKRKGKEPAAQPPPPAPAEPPKPPRTAEQEFWNEDPEPAPAAPVPAERGGRRWGKRQKKGKDEISEEQKRAAEAAAAAGAAAADAAGEPGNVRPAQSSEPAQPDETAQPGGSPRPGESPAPGGSPRPGEPPASDSAVAGESMPERESKRPGEDPAAPSEPPPPVPGSPRTGEGKLPPPLPVEPTPTVEQPLPAKSSGGDRGAPGADPPPSGERALPPEAAAAAAAAGAAAGAPLDPADAGKPPTGEHPVAGEPGEPEHPLTGEPGEPEYPATGEHPVTGEHEPPRTGEYAPLTDQHELPSDEWDAPPAREAIWDDEGDPELAGAAASRRGGRGGGSGGKGSGDGFFRSLRRHPFITAGVIVAVIVFWFLYALFQPFHTGGHGRVQVKIPKGASVSEVGDLLIDKGVIDSPLLPVDGSTMFQIRVSLEGKRSSLYAGNFTLEKGMSYGSAIDALSTPPVKRVTTVTVPEGYTRAQAAEIIKQDGVPGNYEKATVKSKFLKPAEYGGKGAKNLEGFLFPNTFELKPKAPVDDLVELQLKDFKKQIKKVDMKFAKSKNLTVFDVLIIASMIEDEAGVPKQRKLVASVIYNRLKEGMPLGIDATIRFAVGNYDKPLTESQLATDSPYNTRTNTGLPPGPINSPGLEAIQAAAHPAKTDFIFYVNKPNTCNELAFAKTEAEFEENVAAYEKAREENGGNEPSSC